MRLSSLLGAYSSGPDRAAVPPFAVWLALSLVLHLVLMVWMPYQRLTPGAPPDSTPSPVTVYLRPTQPPEAPPPPAPAPPPVALAPPVRPQPPRTPPQPTRPQRADKAKPPVVAQDKPRPENPIVTAPPPAPSPAPKAEEAPAPAPVAKPAPQAAPAPEGDLAAYIESRRRARGEAPAETPPSDADRANRGPVASAGIKLGNPSNANQQRARNGYGSFDIRRRGVDYAEYMFKGWNENFRRDAMELIEVRKENHASIDLAVIRSIIGIIRRTENGEFSWYSYRLGRTLMLSARAQDNGALEEFLLQEFYDDLHRYR